MFNNESAYQQTHNETRENEQAMLAAIQRGVLEALNIHKKMGQKVPVWNGSNVVWIDALQVDSTHSPDARQPQ